MSNFTSPKPVTVTSKEFPDGHTFPSITAAARALNVSHVSLCGLRQRGKKRNVTSVNTSWGTLSWEK